MSRDSKHWLVRGADSVFGVVAGITGLAVTLALTLWIPAAILARFGSGGWDVLDRVVDYLFLAAGVGLVLLLAGFGMIAAGHGMKVAVQRLTGKPDVDEGEAP